MPVEILNNARELYGAASAEINEVFGFGLISISRLVVHKNSTESLSVSFNRSDFLVSIYVI